MAKQTLNNIKLGVFVLAGLLFLVLLLYMIGKNRNIFGSTYILKARFENVQGLVSGNNVRFSGIQSGTVKRIKILNDTVIEVTMLIDKKMLNVIRKDAVASIGTDGLVGNKVVNIIPSRFPSTFAKEGDILSSKKAVDTDEMFRTLFNTNNDLSIITTELKTTVKRINSSDAFWTILNDNSLPLHLRKSVAKIHSAAQKAEDLADNLNAVVTSVRDGKGSLGAILTDSSFAVNLNDAILKINAVGAQTDSIANDISALVKDIKRDMNDERGTLNALIRDTMIVSKLKISLDNIQKGTEGFNQNMEALKNSFFLRGYFRKLEKQKLKEAKQSSTLK
jgi:phospholipid/cholesterol/gamma-HCH transport system substrate-binding protein